MRYKLSDNTWDNNENNALKRVIESGFFSMGLEVSAFEKEFAQKFGVKYAVMSNSGSSANLLAISALVYSGKLKKGDEVIVPAVSWSTTYFPISQMGLKLRFVDIDLLTLNIDIEALRLAITPASKVLLAVNLLGNPNDFESIKIICQKHGLLLVEDNCESMGATFDGKQTGTIGILGTYSTYYSHHICTMEGGVTVTDSEELYHYMLSIRSHGWTRHLPKGSKIYTKKNDPFYESFNFILPGFNLRPLEMEGALGREQLKKLDKIISQRKDNARYFIDKISLLEGYSIQKEIGVSSWFGFAIIMTGRNIGERDKLISLLNANDIETRPIVAGNFTRNKAIEFMDYSICGELKKADYIHDNGFFVGNHSKNNCRHIDKLIQLLSEFNEANR